MSLILGYDAAFPPQQTYPNSQFAFGYIGGNALHVYTAADWATIASEIQFPIWVGQNRSNGLTDGMAAVAAMKSLGFSANPPSGNRRYCVLDMETEINPKYVDDFGTEMWQAGFGTLVYGSLDFVTRNPVKEGYFVADYTGKPHIPVGAGIVACQYANNLSFDNTRIDLDVCFSDLLLHGGQGPRH